MFDVDIEFDEFEISSIKNKEVGDIQNWFINQQSTQIESSDPLALEDFYLRFLEYYVSENELFLKIKKKDMLIGALKGRIEFKAKNEVWISCFLIDSKFRGQGIGTKILNKIKENFAKNYGISIFYTLLVEKNGNIENFWIKNGFVFLRTAKNFYKVNGEYLDMRILKNFV